MPSNRLAGDGGFKGKTILITGATGFLGKVLIEKMLRTCSSVDKIFVLVRTKRDKEPQSRLEEIFSGPLYDLLKRIHGKRVLDKVIAVPGDVAEPKLGLSPADWKMLAENVQIIFHMAATVRFDDPFKKSILLNTRGTRIMLDLAKECKRLLVFAHVSTAYCYNAEVLYEETYSPPANPHEIINVVEAIDDETADLISRRLKGNYPNTYTFTKALAEGLVNEVMDSLPVIILRPSVVIPVWMDPLPGWTDNLNGPAGLLLAAGKGVLRTMYCKPNCYSDFMPVDIVVNGIMATTFYYMTNKAKRVYNLTSSSRIKLTFSEVVDTGKKITTTRLPFNWIVWYPGGSLTSSKLHHKIRTVFYHYLPATILDMLIMLTGHKPVMWRIQKKLSRGFELFEYYTNNQWYFKDDNFMVANEFLTDAEREIYKLDEKGLDVEDYFYNCIHAVRLYILKESDESIPTARIHMNVMWVVDKICKTLILAAFGFFWLQYIIYPLLGAK